MDQKENIVSRKLESPEEIHRLLVEHVKDFLWILDLNLKVTYVSPSVERISGYTFAEIKKLSLDKLLTEESYRAALEIFSGVNFDLQTDQAPEDNKRSMEIEFRCKDNHLIWIEATLSFLRDDNGNPFAILGEGKNITERRKMEKALQKSEARYQLLADNITEHIWMMDLNTLKTIYVSPSVEKMYGYTLHEMEKLSLRKILTKQSFQKMLETVSVEIPKAQATPPPDVHKYSLELQARHKNGHLLWIENTISYLRDETGNLALALGETRDITERKQAEEKLQKTLERLRRAIGTTIQVLVSALEKKDPYTAGHQSRTTDLARTIAGEMGLDDDIIEGIRMAGVIHDIGKLGVPSEILAKPTKLTALEFSLIKEHPTIGHDMLKDVESPWPLAEIVHQHHERINGTGYPQQLKGDAIIFEAKIMAVADVVEAISSHRPYRASLGIDTALEEIETNKGILYDSTVVDACLKLFRSKGYKLPAP